MFIWKLQHSVLTTKVFLRVKILNLDINTLCGWCSSKDESIEYLFFPCELAIWSWEIVHQWWNMDSLDMSWATLWQTTFSRFKYKSFSKGWKIIVVAVLWSIWLARNENVFDKTKISQKSLKKVILYRTFKWVVANEWITQDNELSWYMNPKSSIIKHLHADNQKCWREIFGVSELVAAIDGSWSANSNLGGMGGFIKEKKYKVTLFSGPSYVNGSLEAEASALSHIVSTRARSDLRNKRLTVCTDSKQVETEFNEFKWQNKRASKTGQILEKLGLIIDGLKVMYIKRDHNVEAHVLVVRGRNSNQMYSYWA